MIRGKCRIRSLSLIFSLASQGALSFTPNGHVDRCIPSLRKHSLKTQNKFRLKAKRPKKSGLVDESGAPKQKKGFKPSVFIADYQEGSMDTALCIIPPDDAWDDIQRARHFAKDPSFYTWPPAIRLFHPFVNRESLPEVATAIAQVIEKYELESFEITINKLLVVPHFEDLQQHEEAIKQLPNQAKISDRIPTKEEERVQALIRSEEKKGKKKLAKRRAKEQAMKSLREEEESGGNDDDGEEVENNDDGGEGETRKNPSPREILKEQRKSMAQFNGPCVLCLEPSEESKIHIQAFREILRKKLFPEYDPFSPSSTVTHENTLQLGLPRTVLRQHGLLGSQSAKAKQKKREGSTFRPMITLGRFSTVTKATEVAKKLQNVWEPLTFQVSDLHLVSKLHPSSLKSETEEIDDEKGIADPYSIQVDKNGTPTLQENRELTLRKFHGSEGSDSILTTKGEYGCDAMIMLSGEEHQLFKNPEDDEDEDLDDGFDDDSEEEEEEESSSLYLDKEDEDRIMELLLSPAAIPGGQKRNAGSSTSNNGKAEEVNDKMKTWLEEDDDVDDGATIIIGRTIFLMGEMRQYTGMPASSTMDGKDRVMGDRDVSGSARRRGAVHRQGDRWQEGDYGRKEKDYLP